MPRKIIHLDLDAFFCAVEEQRDPTLHGKPFAVGPRPEYRSVVASCSYAARRYGIHSAMPMARALKLCPELIIVSPHYKAYSEASRQVMEYLHTLTYLVEQVSIDEAFLDLTDIPEPVEAVARLMQTHIRVNFKLPCSLGVATNKLVAKIATNVGKAANRSDEPPNAITVVPSGQEAVFLDPLPTDALWGVGPKTATRMAKLNLLTIGDIARYPEKDLLKNFGKYGHELYLHAHGIDDSPIATSHEVKSISQETTYIRDVNDSDTLHRTLFEQSESVGRRIRQAGLSGTTVKIKLRWSDFTTITRQITLDEPTNQDKVIYQNACLLLDHAWQLKKPVRLLGVGVSGLGSHAYQLSLWADGTEKDRRLQEAVDLLRERYGDKTVKRARDLKQDNDKL